MTKMSAVESIVAETDGSGPERLGVTSSYAI